MAKGAGYTRASKWRINTPTSFVQLYYKNGVRQEYPDLTEKAKELVKKEKNRIAKAMYAKLMSESTSQVIDNGKEISIHYTSKGLKHFANDAMIKLSGKYFSSDSMMNINSILARSTYVPTTHNLTHPRTDGREVWFSYKDADSRDVYLKVSWNNKMKIYEL